MSSGTRESSADPAAISVGGRPWHVLEVEQALSDQGVDEQRGLSSVEVTARASRFGPNRLAAGEEEPWWRAFGRQYLDVM
jgi:magnesium-transporting ATPase (P-type)